MSLSQWKTYFSMHVLAHVPNFPYHTLKHIFTLDEYCRCCGSPSVAYYCDYCEADRCVGCGEIGCGSYMCKSCRYMEQACY